MSSDSDSQNRDIVSDDESVVNPPGASPPPGRSEETESDQPQTQVVTGPLNKGKKAVDADHPPFQFTTWKPGKGKDKEVVEKLMADAQKAGVQGSKPKKGGKKEKVASSPPRKSNQPDMTQHWSRSSSYCRMTSRTTPSCVSKKRGMCRNCALRIGVWSMGGCSGSG